jgi:hypothetical protein
MLRNFTLGVILVGAGLSQADTQTPSIDIGNARLRLGMTFAEVASRLEPAYKLTAVPGNTNTFIVMTKAGPPFVGAGEVRFSVERLLKFARRDWGPSDQHEGVRAVEALYTALTRLMEPVQYQGRSGVLAETCRCSVSIAATPTGESKHIEISDGQRKIVMDVMRGDGSTAGGVVTIGETVGSLK